MVLNHVSMHIPIFSAADPEFINFLKRNIAELEQCRVEMPLGLNEFQTMTLDAFIIALRSASSELEIGRKQ